MDNHGTRTGGWMTMLTGAALAGTVALGGEDDYGNYTEPNPEAGKGILIAGLALGTILAIIPDSKQEISSSVTTRLYDEYVSINDHDTLYTVWSNVYPNKVIRRSLVNEEINLNVATDLALDYVENRDSIQVYFKSNWDENLVYTVDFLASDYLKRYLKVTEVSDSITLYQAPNVNSPVIGYLKKGDNVAFIEKKQQWYKVTWNERKVFLKSDGIDYFFAGQ